MNNDLDAHHRRSIRLKSFDYTTVGAYYVTICTCRRECLFGDVIDGQMVLSGMGQIAQRCWEAVPEHFLQAALDNFIVMPNHMHGIILLTEPRTPQDDVGAQHAVPLPTVPRQRHFGEAIPSSISTLVRSYKSAVTKHINELRANHNAAIWQRNYYEHIIRDERDLTRVREYISHNAMKWEEDENHPRHLPR